MATTTTNFGWDIPQSTDLVKDGATAIAALGQDIDTAFVDFKGGTTGQVLKKTSNTDLDVEWGTASSGLTLINTTSFSAVSSQSINDVFSATYTNYKLIFTGLLSAATNLNLRVRVSGTDLSGSNYNYQYLLVDATSVVGARNINETSMRLGGGSTSDKSTIVEISNPFETKLTDIKCQDTFSTGGVLTATTMFNFAGNVNNSTSYTGFTIFPSSGTITGSISVFGYAK